MSEQIPFPTEPLKLGCGTWVFSEIGGSGLPMRSEAVKQISELFERYVPEIASGVVRIMAIARDGYWTKVAVQAVTAEVDPVRACIGDKLTRVAKIVDELGGPRAARLDIIRWNDSLRVLIPEALQPAETEEVFLYPRLGRAIALVKEDQLARAIGDGAGRNVRLASELVRWDIELMTHEELNREICRAETWFRQIPGITDEMVESFIVEGLLSYHDPAFLEPDALAEVAGVTSERAQAMILFAEEAAEKVEKETLRKEVKGRG
jgi:N utilization substance protein A